MEDPICGFGAAFNGWTPTVTHFWDAENGDDSKISIPASPDAYNAFYKAKIYLFGGHYILYQTKTVDPFSLQTIIGRLYSYSSIIDLYKTGHCYDEGYVDIAGYIHHLEPLEVYMNLETARKFAAQIIGRVAHLLTDMSVPAHAHNDIHPSGDPYEDYMNEHFDDGY